VSQQIFHADVIFHVWQIHWRDRILAFTAQFKRYAAAGDELQVRRGGKQVGNHMCGRDELLKIIEHQQEVFVAHAFAFIDPVFSSGVHLALNSASLGADVVDAYLRKSPDYGRCLKEFERTVRVGVKTYSWFIYHFTQPAFRNLFMSDGSIFKMEEAVLSVLAGDAFGKSPTRLPLFLFKIAYYLVYLFNFRENRAAHRRRVRGVPETVTTLNDYAVHDRP